MNKYSLVKTGEDKEEIELSEHTYTSIKRLMSVGEANWQVLLIVLFEWLIEVVEWMKSDVDVDLSALTEESYRNLVSATKFGLRTWVMFQEEFFGGGDADSEIEV